jgi:hypothetical protein
MKQFLIWVGSKEGMSFSTGGKHSWMLRHTHWDRPYPIPMINGEVTPFITKNLVKKLLSSGICTEQEIIERLK